MFIEVTRYVDDQKQIVQVSNITNIYQQTAGNGYGCTICFVGEGYTRVCESYDEIKELIYAAGGRIHG